MAAAVGQFYLIDFSLYDALYEIMAPGAAIGPAPSWIVRDCTTGAFFDLPESALTASPQSTLMTIQIADNTNFVPLVGLPPVFNYGDPIVYRPGQSPTPPFQPVTPSVPPGGGTGFVYGFGSTDTVAPFGCLIYLVAVVSLIAPAPSGVAVIFSSDAVRVTTGYPPDFN